MDRLQDRGQTHYAQDIEGRRGEKDGGVDLQNDTAVALPGFLSISLTCKTQTAFVKTKYNQKLYEAGFCHCVRSKYVLK